jgi:hypothetical protein
MEPTASFSDPISLGTTSQATMPSLDYTAQDYEATKRYLVGLAIERYGDRYNNLVEHDFGIMLMEFIAALHDKQSLKMDMVANEAFYPTAILPKSIRRHARRVGYVPRSSTAARYRIAATVVQPYDFDIVVPAGLRLATGGSDGRVLFVELYAADDEMNPIVDEDIVIPAGTDAASNIVGIEGQSTSFESDGNGEPFQSFPIPDQSVLLDSVRFEVDGTEWRRLESFAVSGPQKVFKVDSDDKTGDWYVVVGDNASGAVAPLGSKVVVRYRTGGGLRGNVPSGFINVTQAVAVPGTGVNATVTFSNLGRGYGGGEEETPIEIRRALPNWIKSQGRLITLDDYTSFATRYYSGAGRVAKARAYLSRAGCAANVVNVFMVEEGSSSGLPVSPSDTLVRSLREACEDIADCTHHICVRPGTIVMFDVKVHLTLPTSMSSRRGPIETAARGSVAEHFDLNLWNFGLPLTVKGLSARVGSAIPNSIIDVRYDMHPGFSTDPSGNYKTKYNELVRPGSIEVIIDWSNDAFTGGM